MKKTISKIKPIDDRKLVFLFFLSFLVIYYFSSPVGNTHYDYFTRLADAFLQGKIYLTENPHWLNELIPSVDNKFYVPYPPMPAIIALPFRLVFGHFFAQQWLAHILGAGTVALLVWLAQIANPGRKNVHIWTGLFVGASTVLWFLSSVGSSWYLGQVTAAFFLSAALVSAFTNKHGLSGIFIGAAYLARVHTILSIPLFMYIAWKDNKNIKSLLPIFVGIAPFIVFNFLYNFARFGVVWDKGYMLIPGVLDEPWYQLGIIHPSYIPRHLDVIFTALPVFQSAFPYIKPSWAGLAVWFTSPALLFVLFAPLKARLVQVNWLAVVLVSAPIIMHGTNGFAQFGYRFLVDLLPLLTVLLLFSLKNKGLSKLHWILLFVGILVNLWGILWINKLGWVVV